MENQILVDPIYLYFRGCSSLLSQANPAPAMESKTFDHVLRDGTAVKLFYGKIDGKPVVFHVYKDGKYATQIATSVVRSPEQMANWGILP